MKALFRFQSGTSALDDGGKAVAQRIGGSYHGRSTLTRRSIRAWVSGARARRGRYARVEMRHRALRHVKGRSAQHRLNS